MSLLKTIRQQLGLSNTAANNFVLDASADNGTMKLARGNAGATTQDVMTVDAAGKVSFPENKVPAFKAVLTATQSIVANTWSVALMSEVFDTTAAYEPSTGRFTPQVAGYYLITGNININATSNLTSASVVVRKNGSNTAFEGYASGITSGGTGGSINNVACVVYLNGSTDYVDLAAIANAGAVSPVLAPNLQSSQFSGALVRAA